MANILISNDDGYQSIGIDVLQRAASSLGNTFIVAPSENRSAVSSALSVHGPLKVQEIEKNKFSVSGTPCDCVHLAISEVLGFSVDCLVSGINHGANLGDDVLHSGTLAAAMEGRFLDTVSIAFSITSAEGKHLQEMTPLVEKLMRWAWQSSFPKGSILNINIPDLPPESLKGCEFTKLGRRKKFKPAVCETDLRGRQWYWLNEAGAPDNSEQGTDFDCISRGLISITPINIDMTQYALMDYVTPPLL